MSNLNSYNILINRFKAFADGHFLLKNFTYGAITLADLQKFGLYPFMHIVPVDVSYESGVKNFSFDVFFADLPREEENKAEYQKETLSDLQQIAEDLLGEITNHRVIFGKDVSVISSRLVPFEEEFSNVLTGWNLSITLQIPYNWSACEIPASFNDFIVYNQSTGESSVLEFKDSIVREGGEVRLVNDLEFPPASYYYGTNSSGERGWFIFPTDEVGLTCETLGACSTIIDIETNIENLETDVEDLSANVVQVQTDLTTLEESLSAVATSGDYNDLINQPTIPTYTDFIEDSITNGVTTKAPSENAVYDALALKFNIPTGTTTDYLDGLGTPTPFPESLPTSTLRHEVKLGSTMTKGTPVYVSGADGTNMVVSPASNTSEATSSKTMGLLMSGGNTNAKVFVITEGLLSGLNTSTATIGDAVWLGSTGTLLYGLANKPVAPLHMVFIGIVTRVNSNNGEIFVKVQNGFELEELHNVLIQSVANNEGLFYDSATSLWKNKTIQNVLGYTPFNLPSLTSGSVLFSNGTTIAQDNANLFWDDTNNRLGIGTTSPADLLTLNANGTNARIRFNNTNSAKWTIGNVGNDNSFRIGNASDFQLTMFQSTGNLVLQNGGTFTDAGFRLDVNGSVRTTGSISAASLIARGTYLNQTLVATANNDVLVGLDIAPTFTTGAFTGVAQIGLRVNGSVQSSIFFSGVSLGLSSGSSAQPISFYLNQTSTLIGRFFGTTGNLMLQNGGTFTDVASARLTINSTTQGFLPPRMTTTQKNAIASPVVGLVVYDTTLNKLCVRGASAWETITSV